MNQYILKVEKLTKNFYLYEQDASITSCADINLEVKRGSLTAIVGPTGSGKSSVLKCIYRTYLPTSGSIWYRDAENRIIDLARASDKRILEIRRRDIRFVTQFLSCLPRKGALDVVSEPLISVGEDIDTARDSAAELLRFLNVPERLWNVPPATFSGGEKQRVNLARGLIVRPRLLLLDEPTASLDPATTERAIELLETIRDEGVAMLAIFHQPELVQRVAKTVVELNLSMPISTIEDLVL